MHTCPCQSHFEDGGEVNTVQKKTSVTSTRVHKAERLSFEPASSRRGRATDAVTAPCPCKGKTRPQKKSGLLQRNPSHGRSAHVWDARKGHFFDAAETMSRCARNLASTVVKNGRERRCRASSRVPGVGVTVRTAHHRTPLATMYGAMFRLQGAFL